MLIVSGRNISVKIFHARVIIICFACLKNAKETNTVITQRQELNVFTKDHQECFFMTPVCPSYFEGHFVNISVAWK